jgi:predicted molibdopterin-dependent oxidoreductase YjgC
MIVYLNNKETAVNAGETVIEAATGAGIDIPSLCYVKGAAHRSSCMVCAVKDCKSGQIIPSCTTLATEGMSIDTECKEVQDTRRLSLELLLSDHRADCEAPCTLSCPNGLDIERMIYFYDMRSCDRAYELIAAAFPLPELKCDSCKVPCEKACRRKMVDRSVDIRALITEICGKYESPEHILPSENVPSPKKELQDKQTFFSRPGRFTETEKTYLKTTVTTASRCLHCACAGRDGCKLRRLATAMNIKRSRYEASSSHRAMSRQKIGKGLWFEPARCIKCGLCVYNSNNGFTFSSRGFWMEVVIPEENIANITPDIAELCPTGAIYDEFISI